MHDVSTFHVFSAYRTAICKAKRGSFKDTLPEDLLVPVFKVSVCYLVSLLQPKQQFSEVVALVSSSFPLPISGFGG